MTSTEKGHTTIISEFFKSIYNGTFQNTMYFYEQNRNIAVVFSYNYLTGKGEYTACIWHNNPAQPGGNPWSRKTHRHTASDRFVKCPRIPFEFAFNPDDKFFYPNLKNAVRRTIHEKGVKGSPKPVVDSPTIILTTASIHSLKEFEPTTTSTQVKSRQIPITTH